MVFKLKLLTNIEDIITINEFKYYHKPHTCLILMNTAVGVEWFIILNNAGAVLYKKCHIYST